MGIGVGVLLTLIEGEGDEEGVVEVLRVGFAPTGDCEAEGDELGSGVEVGNEVGVVLGFLLSKSRLQITITLTSVFESTKVFHLGWIS